MPPKPSSPTNMMDRQRAPMPLRSPSGLGRARARKGDSQIRKGAEIIREQIRKKLDEADAYRTTATAVTPDHAGSSRSSSREPSAYSLTAVANSGNNQDQLKRQAELKWNNAIGERESSTNSRTATTCSSAALSIEDVVYDDDESNPFWGHSGTKNRSAVYDSFLGDNTNRNTNTNAASNIKRSSRRETETSDFFCSVPTCAVPALTFQEKVQQWTPASGEKAPMPPDDDTPITMIGRGKSLRSKMVTYLVEPFDDDSAEEHDNDTYTNDTYGSASDMYSDDFDVDASAYHSVSTGSYLPPSLQTREQGRMQEQRYDGAHVIEDLDSTSPAAAFNPYGGEQRQSPPRTEHKTSNSSVAVVVSPESSLTSRSAPTSTNMDVPFPISPENMVLRRDAAYRHAMNAGFLWQSLVGQHIRFPSTWWDGARAPPMGANHNADWQFMGRYNIQSNKFLNAAVRSRGSAGQLLLHLVVQDLMTWKPVQDVVIGCFHPNARGIRRSSQADPREERGRDLWLAVRKRSDQVSAVDSLLLMGKSGKQEYAANPLGQGMRVTNHNVRATFGESPPLETVFVPESDLYQRLSGVVISQQKPPPLALLEQYVFG